jgi:hypothetical protein
MTTLEIVCDYIRRGWLPLPIPDRSKNPGDLLGRGWEVTRITEATAPRYFNGEARNIGVVIEIRFGDGLQTVFPGSRHEDTGEAITWVKDCSLPDIDGMEIKRSCALAAASALLANQYPREGARHDAARTLNGFLRRCSLSNREMTLFAHAITTAAKSYAGDRDGSRQDLATIEDMKPLVEDRTPSFHSMCQFFDKPIVGLAADWLG